MIIVNLAIKLLQFISPNFKSGCTMQTTVLTPDNKPVTGAQPYELNGKMYVKLFDEVVDL